MVFLERYGFLYKDKNIIIEIGKFKEYGQIIYVAKSNFKNIIAVAECWETALQNCVKKIKFAFLLSEKKVRLMNENQAKAIVKKQFGSEFDDMYRRYGDRLSHSVFVEDELMIFNIVISEKDKHEGDYILPSIAIVYVNLITGECDMVKRCKDL